MCIRDSAGTIRSFFIPASNEPSSHACMDIWRLPRGSNTPLLAAEYLIAAGTLMPAAFLGRKNKPGFIASGFITASGMSSRMASGLKMASRGSFRHVFTPPGNRREPDGYRSSGGNIQTVWYKAPRLQSHIPLPGYHRDSLLYTSFT